MKPAEDYILSTKEPYRSILLYIQLIIEATVPEAVMLYKYKIPFYYLEGKQPFCYLNETKDYVDLGFSRGAHFTKHIDKQVSKNRKHLKSLCYFSSEEMNETVLTDILREVYSCTTESTTSD